MARGKIAATAFAKATAVKKSAKAMKPSGVAWLGDIPEGWEVDLIGSFYSQRNEKVSDRDYPPLSVTMKGVLPQLATVAKTDDGDNRKLVKKGDFAINSRSDRRGSCGISEYDGSVSLINTILMPRGEMEPRYYNWLFHTDVFADEFYKWGHGIVDDLWTTRWSEMKRIQIVRPPLPEQRAIADYLDEKCGAIDAAIAEAKKGIEEYKAWKKSLIFEAVTGKIVAGGSRSSRPMRSSGIPWLGDVPEEWEMKRLRYLATSFRKGAGITKADVIENGCIACIRYGEIYSRYKNYVAVEKCLSRTNENLISCPQRIYKGDILFSCTGELVEEIGKNIAYLGDEECLAGGDIIVVGHNQDPVFLSYALNSYAQTQKSHDKTKLKVVHISTGDIKNLLVAIPPLAEQRTIADYLDKKCAAIDAMVVEKEALIADLEAYKKSLIYETVTGKREVV